MFANELRRAVETAPRMKLPEVASLMWRACAEQQITEAEAEELSGLIEARNAVPPSVPAPRTSVGSRPRSGGSMERRRSRAASGRLPPALAARFTQAETVARTGDCRRCIDQIGALAGVCRSTVKNALREAAAQGLVTVEQRRQSTWRNMTNIVRIVSPEWLVWNRLARRSPPGGGGVKFPTGSNTGSLKRWEKRGSRSSRRLPNRQRQGSGEEPDANSTARQERPGHVDNPPSQIA
jgi:hypothetical protein